MNKQIRLSILTILSAISASAQSKTTIKGDATVSVLGNIACVTRPGEKTYTLLGDRWEMILRDRPTNIIELDHKTAWAEGCDIQKLEKLSQQAGFRFGFLEAKINVTKEVSEAYKNNKGECLARLTETVELDLGEGVILSSLRHAERSSNSCKN